LLAVILFPSQAVKMIASQKRLQRILNPIHRVPGCFLCFVALFELYLVVNTILSIKIIESITTYTVRIANRRGMVKYMVLLL
jgi:hypothetical protein